MTPHSIVAAVMSAMVVAALFYYRDAVAEAIRRGPWNGGGPSPLGPAPAADPFLSPFARWKRKRSERSEE